MEHLRLDRVPGLHDPVAIVAFAGWNDAATSATTTARFVIRRLGARRFASIDPEPFFDFREARPVVRIDSGGERTITWPANEFFYARNPIGPHDIVIAVGVEPHLRWQTFADTFRALFGELGVGLTVSLGALMADVPHTREVRVTGSAADAGLAARLGLAVSRYQGPTGVPGVLGDVFRHAGHPWVSLWANVPHYVTTSQNPPATIALLRRLESLLGLGFDYSELNAAAERFRDEVDTAVLSNPEIAAYVHRLEESHDSGAGPGDDAGPPPGDLLLDIEEFLREQRDE